MGSNLLARYWEYKHFTGSSLMKLGLLELKINKILQYSVKHCGGSKECFLEETYVFVISARK